MFQEQTTLTLIALLLTGCGPRSTPYEDAELEPDADQDNSAVDADNASDAELEPDADGELDEMILIPAGPFLRKSDRYDLVRETFISEFWIDRFEVTNEQFRSCVEDGACLPPLPSSVTRTDYFTNPLYNRFPVVTIQWDQADRFCRWAGKRLPTAAEWEKAARGGCEILGEDETCELETDAPDYPWGEELPGTECAFANSYRTCVGDTTEVGSYPAGASPYGAYDMLGNVMEWVNDWYVPDYIVDAPDSDPQGPSERQAEGECNINFDDPCRVLQSSPYSSLNPEGVSINDGAGGDTRIAGYADGFRCARDAEE